MSYRQLPTNRYLTPLSPFGGAHSQKKKMWKIVQGERKGDLGSELGYEEKKGV